MKKDYYQTDLIGVLWILDPVKLRHFFEVNIAKYRIRQGEKKSIAKDVLSDALILLVDYIDEDNVEAVKEKFNAVIEKYDKAQALDDNSKLHYYSTKLEELNNPKENNDTK
jgi:hypothetical protein